MSRKDAQRCQDVVENHLPTLKVALLKEIMS